MRTLLFALALCLAPAAYGQTDIWAINSAYQNQFNNAYARAYYAPYYSAYSTPYYGGGGGYGYRAYQRDQTNYELRQIRYSIEDAAFQQRWSGFNRQR